MDEEENAFFSPRDLSLLFSAVKREFYSNKYSPGAPTPKRPKVGMSYDGKRRARRWKGAGAKVSRCLVSVLTKRGINSVKQVSLY